MDTYDLVSKHPLLAILRNVPPEKTIDYAAGTTQIRQSNILTGM